MSNTYTKEALNKVTHSVRAAQAVLQYGVGAMVDFPDQTLVTAAPEFWGATEKIFDERFARALGVDYFALPADVAYERFPRWYFCPKCRKFQPLEKWITEYQSGSKTVKLSEKDPAMVKHMQCPQCKQDLVVSRIVTICEAGHLNDFPWIEWVHARAKKSICGNASLKFKTGASGSEGLEGLCIECSCGARTTLRDAFDKDIFKTLQEESSYKFKCPGNHPFNHTVEHCDLFPRTVQKGASSVYFPVTHSSLVIPPYADKLNTRIEQSNGFKDCIVKIDDEETIEEKLDLIKKRLSKWAEKIALEIGALSSDVERILQRKWLTQSSDIADVTSVRYRFEEYMALTGEISTPKGTWGDFLRESMPVQEYGIPHVKAIALIDKVRVVNALTGFSRINPAMSEEDPGFVSVKKSGTRWYPAYEVRGEGIFIQFDENEIIKWENKHEEVKQRAETLATNYSTSYIGRNHPKKITPKFILLHTLAHLLISQLSFECGYSVASLSERIYCSDFDDGKTMAGILIYTASGDSEGTLGGLVRQGRSDAFPRVFWKAINSAKTCSNDPVCIMSRGQGRDSLNLAACHACALLPETCCEERNSFLDRGMVVGTFDKPEIGFWYKTI